MAAKSSPIPAAADIELTDENWDLDAWLDGTEYAERQVEVFNNGKLLSELDELQKFIKVEEQAAADRKQTSQLIGSIVDEDPERVEATGEAKAAVDKIIESLKGTGVIYHVLGISPGEREAIEKKVAAALKPSGAKVEEIDGETLEIEPAKLGGRKHPDWFTNVGYELAAKGIIGIIPPAKTRDGERPAERKVEYTPEYVRDRLEAKLGGSEWARLINAVYEVNYYSYDIDSKVTVDFS